MPDSSDRDLPLRGPSELCFGLVSALTARKEDWLNWSIHDASSYEVILAKDTKQFSIRRQSALVRVSIEASGHSITREFRTDVACSYALESTLSQISLYLEESNPSKVRIAPPSIQPHPGPTSPPTLKQLLEYASKTGSYEFTLQLTHRYQFRWPPTVEWQIHTQKI